MAFNFKIDTEQNFALMVRKDKKKWLQKYLEIINGHIRQKEDISYILFNRFFDCFIWDDIDYDRIKKRVTELSEITYGHFKDNPKYDFKKEIKVKYKTMEDIPESFTEPSIQPISNSSASKKRTKKHSTTKNYHLEFKSLYNAIFSTYESLSDPKRFQLFNDKMTCLEFIYESINKHLGDVKIEGEKYSFYKKCVITAWIAEGVNMNLTAKKEYVDSDRYQSVRYHLSKYNLKGANK